MDKTNLGRLMGCCGRLAKLHVDAELRRSGYDITPVQSHALLFLSHHKTEEITQRDLEHSLKLKPSTINGLVERLLEKNYISRTPSLTDGRCRLLRLTEEGEAMVDSFRAALERTDRTVVSALSDEEQETLVMLLRRVVDTLEKEVNKP